MILPENSTPNKPFLSPMADSLLTWIRSPDWTASKQYLENHPILLTGEAEAFLKQGLTDPSTEEAQAFLAQILREAPNEASARSTLQLHRTLLNRGREVGTETAYAEWLMIEGLSPELQGLVLQLGLELGQQFRHILDQASNHEELQTGLVQHTELLQAIERANQRAAFRESREGPFPLEFREDVNQLAYLQEEAPRNPSLYQQVIAHCEKILARLDIGQYPELRVAIQNELGNAFLLLTVGDRNENLAQAVHCYQAVLPFYPPNTKPLTYARTQYNLGLAYYSLSSGQRAGTLVQAIQCFQEALRFWTPEVAPLSYAMARHNLGLAYADLPTGDRTENLAQAIRCYQQALRFRTPEVTPLGYARTQVCLGEAYRRLPSGDRGHNLAQAIQCYHEALRFYTPQTAPLDYAATRHNLGIAYVRLPTGDRALNVTQAIHCYQEALRFYTPQAAPMAYARTQNSLGNAFLLLPGGDRAAHIRSAIHCFREALRFYQPDTMPMAYAQTQHNLGNAYRVLLVGHRGKNLALAIRCFQTALRFYTPESAPLDYAQVQHNLGNVYAYLPTGDRANHVGQAIQCYQEALRFRTPETTPNECRRTLHRLGRLYFRERQWQLALNAYRQALFAGEKLYRETVLDTGRQAELGETSDIVSDAAYCLAKLGQLLVAVTILEQGRARTLAEALARDRTVLEQVQPDDRRTFVAIRDRIVRLQAEARRLSASDPFPKPLSGRTYVALSDELRQACTELDAVIAHIQSYLPYFMQQEILHTDIVHIAQKLNAPLVYLVATSQGSMALVVSPTVETLLVWADDLNIDDINSLLYDTETEQRYLHGIVGGALEALRHVLPYTLTKLAQLLMGPVVERLHELDCTTAYLIPTGKLALFPLHATVLAGKIIWAYAPSARALAASYDILPSNPPQTFLAIVDPKRDLPFTELEVALIRPKFSTQEGLVLTGSTASLTATQTALAGQMANSSPTYLHFACHGVFNPVVPLESSLILTGEDRLTLSDLLDKLRLQDVRLAVLSACQTAVTDFRHAPDEAIGLPAGFLQAGVPGVVSTLWEINDLSTMVLMERFYARHLAGLSPASALQEAQLWLQEVTASELAIRFEMERQKPDRERGVPYEQASAAWRRFVWMEPDERPFAHPYYWAAFTFTGA